MGLLCKGAVQSFQLTNKLQHCVTQSSCSAGRCRWTLHPQEGWCPPPKRGRGVEGSTSRSEKPALPAARSCLLLTRPLAGCLGHPLLPDAPKMVAAGPVRQPSCARHGARPARHPRQGCAAAEPRGARVPGAMWLSSGKPDFQNRKVNCCLLSKLLSHFLIPLSFIFPICFLKSSIHQTSAFQGPNQSQVQDQ